MSARSFRFDPAEPVPDEVRRVARGRIDHALDELRGDSDSTREEAVHEARKDMKKLRALLRLVRDELGDDVYRRENVSFRDAGRRLAGARDSQVLLETLAAVSDRERAARDSYTPLGGRSRPSTPPPRRASRRARRSATS